MAIFGKNNMKDKESFYHTPFDYFMEVFRPETKLPLEALRQSKLIGSNLEAALIIYAHECNDFANYDFFRLWSNQKWGGLREICGVSLVETRREFPGADNKPLGFRIEAISLRDNEQFSKCPRCRFYHTRKNCWNDMDEDKNVGYICEECEQTMIDNFPAHKVTLEILELI